MPDIAALLGDARRKLAEAVALQDAAVDLLEQALGGPTEPPKPEPVPPVVSPAPPKGKPAAPTLSGLPWPSGIGQAADDAEAFVRWRGRPLDVFACFVSREGIPDWDGLRGGPAGRPGELGPVFGAKYAYHMALALKTLPKQTRLVWIYPTLPTGLANNRKSGAWSNPGVWRKLIDPKGDLALVKAVWSEVGQRVAVWLGQQGWGLDRLTLNLGHEATGDWYPWSIGPDVAAWQAYWRIMVDHLRAGLAKIDSKAPDQVRIEWRVAGSRITDGRYRIDQVYPGDAWVDVIGRSLHETARCWDSDAAWAAELAGDATTDGLQAVLDFARSHGKLLGLDEWSLQEEADGPSFPASPAPRKALGYIRRFLEANADDIAFECWLHSSGRRLVGRDGVWDGAKAYLKGWGAEPDGVTKAARAGFERPVRAL